MTPQDLRGASASAGRRPGRDSRRTPGIGWLGWIEQDARNQTRGDKQFRRGGSREGTEQIIVLGADGGAGIAVGYLVSGLVGLLVGNLGGIEAMVGNEDSLQAIEDEQPGVGLEMMEELFGQFGGLAFC